MKLTVILLSCTAAALALPIANPIANPVATPKANLTPAPILQSRSGPGGAPPDRPKPQPHKAGGARPPGDPGPGR
ncbi:hypothetical protein Vi05172_g9839 [Venturia inaequalis]|nr:hypothetical protein Vi05172_g9839 [Venturia inaequalis]